MLSSFLNKTHIKLTHPCCANCINCYRQYLSSSVECRLAYELAAVSEARGLNCKQIGGIENSFCEVCDNFVSKDTIQPLIRAKSSAEIEVLAASGALVDIPKIYVVAKKNFIIENFEKQIDEEFNKVTDAQIYSTVRFMHDIVHGNAKPEVPVDLLPLTCDFMKWANNAVAIRLELSNRRSVHWKFINYMKHMTTQF